VCRTHTRAHSLFLARPLARSLAHSLSLSLAQKQPKKRQRLAEPCEAATAAAGKAHWQATIKQQTLALALALELS